MDNQKIVKISAGATAEVKAALLKYAAAVTASDLSESSQATYIDMADNFVRWLGGEFEPGSRVGAYSSKKKRDPVT